MQGGGEGGASMSSDERERSVFIVLGFAIIGFTPISCNTADKADLHEKHAYLRPYKA